MSQSMSQSNLFCLTLHRVSRTDRIDSIQSPRSTSSTQSRGRFAKAGSFCCRREMTPRHPLRKGDDRFFPRTKHLGTFTLLPRSRHCGNVTMCAADFRTNLSRCCHVRRRFPTLTHTVTGPLCGLRRVPVPVPVCFAAPALLGTLTKSKAAKAAFLLRISYF